MKEIAGAPATSFQARDALFRVQPAVLTWTALSLLAFGSRLIAVFLLPNAEQDGYSYAEIITRWSESIRAGEFHLADLFGFWMPLFPLTAAIPNIWMQDAVLAGKMLSGLCGAISCLLVFAIAKKLTHSVLLGGLAYAALLSSPLHTLYSASGMTDVPHGCLILASLWFALQRRWIGAAIFAAVAGGIRNEAWALIVFLPLIQFVYERRVSLLAVAILLFPPLAWLAVAQVVTGDPLAFFVARARYQASYMDFHPTRAGLALADIRQDLGYLLLGATRAVAVASIAAGGWSILRMARRHRPPPFAVWVTLAYMGAFFGFIFLAYVTRWQPVIFPRYALIFFVIGLPLLVWLIQSLIKRGQPSRLAKLMAVALMAFCFWEAKRQFSVTSKVLADFRAHQHVAQTLATAFRESNDLESRCFSDDAGVRVLSGLPPETFLRSETATPLAWQSIQNFEFYLREKHVAYLVFTHIEASLPAKFYPNLGSDAPSDTSHFQLITVARSPFASDVWLYRLCD